jgi:hypothetical protein
MPDKDVVLAKVASIQKCLRRIKEITGLDPVYTTILTHFNLVGKKA